MKEFFAFPGRKGMGKKQQRFDKLVSAYYSDLFRYAYWLCHNNHIAEDLVQETCLRAWHHLDSLTDGKAAKSWLMTILRRENARRFERKQLDQVSLDEALDAADPAPSPAANTQLEQLRKQIQTLTVEYREPLVLQLIGGFTTKEIATITELNEKTVSTRLFRARQQLRQSMNPGQDQIFGGM